ncbi:hypothetical protein O0L34_g5429 [Tuta absoluta]|nr:hypothetical protein O0L34_g5429 [Tuta absoluta]
MTDIMGRDAAKNGRSGASRNTNAQSVFDAYTHRPVVRSGYCESIMFYDKEAAASGQDVAVVTTDEPTTNATIPHARTLLPAVAQQNNNLAVGRPMAVLLLTRDFKHYLKKKWKANISESSFL